MSGQLFVSRSAFLALADEGDPDHGRATELLEHLEGALVTSNLVVMEVVERVESQAGHSKALEVLGRLRDEGTLKVYHLDAEMERRGWELFTRGAGGRIAPSIAMNVALMRELGIRIAFTFERGYRDAGFITIPMTDQP